MIPGTDIIAMVATAIGEERVEMTVRDTAAVVVVVADAETEKNGSGNTKAGESAPLSVCDAFVHIQ